MYKLFGKSNPPNAMDVLKETVEAKLGKYISIPVQNWLKQTQRFKVYWDIIGEKDDATFIRGANTFDVQGDSSKVHKNES